MITLEQVEKRFRTSEYFHFDTVQKKNGFRVNRERIIPSRGIFRMLLPVVYTKVKVNEGVIRYRIFPDRVAIFMLFMLVGALIIELRLDRDEYPREYPPEFIYGLAIVYALLVILEFFLTRKKVRQVIAGIRNMT